MEKLISKINKILQESNIDGIKIEDKIDAIRLFEKVVAINNQLSKENENLQKEKEESLKRIEDLNKLILKDTRDMCSGKTSAYEELKIKVVAADNNKGISIIVDLLKKIYRGLRNQFGKESFKYDENKRF